jgi:hypothetical protein
MASDSLEEFMSEVSEDGTHECIVDSISLNPSQKDGRVWLVIRYEVDDENSDINGEELTEMMQDFSHLKKSDLVDMTPKDKSNARKTIRRKHERLESLGVAEVNLSDFKDWDSLAGTRVKVTVENSVVEKKDPETGKKIKKTYSNIKDVSLI